MITSPVNDRVRLIRQLQDQRKIRLRQGRFVVEGVRLVEEAVAAGMQPDFVLYSETQGAADDRLAQLLARLEPMSGPILSATDAVIATCSDTETPQGIVAVVPLPDWPRPLGPTTSLVVDRLRDPGNLGTILRTALAAGIDQVWLAPGTVDPTNPKVVRAAMGAHFRLPLYTATWTEIAAALAGAPAWLAEVGTGQPYWSVDWRSPVALIIGGEAEGASPEAHQLATGQVTIPMPGGSESLNAAVASGILLFEIVRQRAGEDKKTRRQGDKGTR